MKIQIFLLVNYLIFAKLDSDNYRMVFKKKNQLFQVYYTMHSEQNRIAWFQSS